MKASVNRNGRGVAVIIGLVTSIASVLVLSLLVSVAIKGEYLKIETAGIAMLLIQGTALVAGSVAAVKIAGKKKWVTIIFLVVAYMTMLLCMSLFSTGRVGGTFAKSAFAALIGGVGSLLFLSAPKNKVKRSKKFRC